MTDFAPAELPLAIDRVQGSRPSAGEIRLALSGTWQGPRGEADHEPLLVVRVESRRHRFPADRDDHAGELTEGRWRATFSVPDWAEPRREGQAAVWIGNAVVPVPPLHGSQNGPTREHQAPALPAARHPPTVLGDAIGVAEPSQGGLDSKAQVKPEDDLVQRQASAEGPAHEQPMAELIAVHEREIAELRAMAEDREEALRRAREEAAVAGLRADRRETEGGALREELASSHVAREAALSELAGLQAEMVRIGGELAVTRERVAGESGHLGQANRLLAEAKSLAEEIRRGRDG